SGRGPAPPPAPPQPQAPEAPVEPPTMIARSDTQIAETFKTTAVELAGDLCQASRPLLPVLQGSMLRVDELCVTSGLEGQSPLAATVMALGPAVAAAGASV